MLRLGTKVRYDGRDAVIVARTIELEPRYDLLFPDTRRIEPYIPRHRFDVALVPRAETEQLRLEDKI